MADPYAKFYSGDMAPPTPVNGKLVPTPTTTDWNDFYGSVGITGKEPAGPDLTSRSVKTVAIDPFTGQPIAPGGGGTNPQVAAAMAQQKLAIQPSWATDTRRNAQNTFAVNEALKGATPVRVAVDQSGKPYPMLDAGQLGYGPATGSNPAVAAALQMAQGGIKPSWANPPGFGPRFPVAATPQVQMAYADVVAGKPGALKKYADLLADQAQAGNIGFSQPGAGGGKAPVIPTSFKTSNTGRTVQVGQTYQGTNGYTYQAMPDGTFQNLGYSAEEQAKRDAQGKAIAAANRKNPNPTYTVSGDNNSFQPKSVQESTRWQTGY